MLGRWYKAFSGFLPAALVLLAVAAPCNLRSQAKSAASDPPIVKSVGTIKSVRPDSITVSPESGGDVTATLSSATKILRVSPGEKDLKNAATLQPQDLQAGDRVLVRGQTTSDAHTVSALAVIVMKQGEVSAKQQRERDDWRKRGVDGLVSRVDSAAGTVTISSGGLGASHNVTVHVGKDTVLRRYAPNSVRFEDAKIAPLTQVQIGDQLRARGAKSPDSGDISAEEVVSGTFRNLAGTITAVNAANNSVTVQDRISKTVVVVKISSDSQVKQLPAEMAQRMAARLKGDAGTNGGHGMATQTGGTSGTPPTTETHTSQPGAGPNGTASSANGNGPPDFQRLLSRLPNSTLADLAKGDAVMVLSTQGGESGTATAITFLAGVEPILNASPNRTASSLLSPWSLNAGGESEGGP
jgi:Domain of unknown function (DUF5666)